MLGAGILDVAAVLVFAATGRASHGGAESIQQVLGVASPFLIGLALGWLVLGCTGRLAHPAQLDSGLIVVASVLLVGLGYRIVTGAAAPAFLVVAVISLTILLLGWRAVAAGLRRAAGRIRTT